MTNTKIRCTDDNYTVNFADEEDFLDFLRKIEKETSVIETTTGEIKATAITGGGLLISELRSDGKISEEISDEAVLSTASDDGSNIAIIHDNNGYLLSEFAAYQLNQKLGCDCAAYTKIPLTDKIGWLNTAAKAIPDKPLTLVCRGEKIRGILSTRYKAVDVPTIYESSSNYLCDNFEEVEFDVGFFSHEESFAFYAIKDPSVLKTYKEWAANRGFTFSSDSYIRIRVATSDVAATAVSLDPELYFGPSCYMPLGNPIWMPHLKSASIQEWTSKIAGVAGRVDDLVSAVAKLGEIKINHPMECFASLGQECGFGKRALAAYADEFAIFISSIDENEISAHDIFYGLNCAISNIKSQATKDKVSENLSRALHPSFDWVRYDSIL